jgi:beta-carotene 3-hydroxylase
MPGIMGGFWYFTYGLAIFFVHDLIIHQRQSIYKQKNVFVLALRRAHKMHHKIWKRRWRKF